MSDTIVTFQGWVGADVVLRKASGHSVVDLRVATTARLKRAGEWVDGDTTWYTVSVWREQADNILRSVKKGDPVIVHGRLRTEVFERQNGETGSKLVIDGALVGHDLRRGVSQFTRTPRPESGDDAAERGEEDSTGAGTASDWGAPSVVAGPGEQTGGSDAA